MGIELRDTEWKERLLRAEQAARTAGRARPAAGGVLLVCPGRSGEADPERLEDQLLWRLTAELEAAAADAWLLRVPRLSGRMLAAQLRGLPGRPSAIVAVGISHAEYLEVLRGTAPVVQVGPRLARARGIVCVEHDAALEAQELARLATRHRAERIGFVARIDRPAGRRRIDGGDVAVLRALTAESHNRHIAVGSSLTCWLDGGQSLETSSVVERIRRQPASRVLLVVRGVDLAEEAATALAGLEAVRVVGRHWHADGSRTVPVIGPDVEGLARVVLSRLPGVDMLPEGATVLVRPVWHRGI